MLIQFNISFLNQSILGVVNGKLINGNMSKNTKYLIAVAASFYVGTIGAQTISINNGQPGNVLENTTVDRVSVGTSGTEATISNVTVNGMFSLTQAATADLNNVTINCGSGSSSCNTGISVNGVQGSIPGEKGILTGNGVNITSGTDGISNSAGSALVDLKNLTVTAGRDGIYTNSSVVKDGVLTTTKVEGFDITAGRYGVYGFHGGQITLTDGSVSTTGNAGHGVHLWGAYYDGTTATPTTAWLNGVTVTTTGDGAHGLYSVQAQSGTGGTGYVNRGAYSYLDNSHLITEGTGSHGIYLSYSTNQSELGNNSSVLTKGNDSYGILALNAVAKLDSSHVRTEGTNSSGIYSYLIGNVSLANGSSVETAGANAHGALARYAGRMSFADSSIHAMGAGANGINVSLGSAQISGTNYDSSIQLDKSSVVSDQGYALALQGGGMTVNVTDKSTLTGAAGLMNVEDYSGTVTPSYTQGVTTANLTADGNSVLNGRVQTASTAVSNLTLQGGSLWQFDNDSNVSTLANRNSTILFLQNHSSTNGFSTLRVDGNYTGDNGTIVFNGALEGDNSATDRLVVSGDVSGQTWIKVANRGGLGQQTQNGIKIIEVGGLSPADAFRLKSDYVAPNGLPAVVAGAYGYSLYQGTFADPSGKDWYLRSEYLDGAAEKPIYQPGTPLYESYANVLFELNGLPTLRERVGTREWSGAGQRNAGHNGVWGWTQGSHRHMRPGHSTTDASQDINIWRMQVGIDRQVASDAHGDVVAGVNMSYGYANADIDSVYGHGKIDSSAYGLGATLTWYGNDGFYVDGQAKLNWFRSDLKSKTLDVTETKGNHGFGYAMSAEAGKRIPLNGDGKWALTPQAQIVYSHVGYDDFVDAYDAAVSLRNHDRVTGRAGMSVDYSQGESRGNELTAFGMANLYRNFNGNSRVKVDGVSFSQEYERTWFGLGGGFQYTWNRGKYAIFGQAETQTSVQSFGKSYGIAASAGLRILF